MTKDLICLAIESTAHTFSIGIVTAKGKILANTKDVYTTKHGGIIPTKLAQHHVDVCDKVFNKALKEAKIKIKDIDIVAFSQGPGLGHGLRIGAHFAKVLAMKYNLPLVPVDHCVAHLEIGRLVTKAKDPVLLYASGANTQVIAYEGNKYRIFGETLDQGVGNFIDSFAREAGLGFPGGPKIEKLAKKGKNLIELPYTVKGMDVSFGGLLTNVTQKLKKHPLEDLCYSIQETIFAMLLEVSERAMAHCNKTELLLGGGVCCNKRLQKMAEIMCKERQAKLYIPENSLLVDNGAQIGWLGIEMYNAGITIEPKKADIKPYERTDDIEVTWR